MLTSTVLASFLALWQAASLFVWFVGSVVFSLQTSRSRVRIKLRMSRSGGLGPILFKTLRWRSGFGSFDAHQSGIVVFIEPSQRGNTLLFFYAFPIKPGVKPPKVKMGKSSGCLSF